MYATRWGENQGQKEGQEDVRRDIRHSAEGKEFEIWRENWHKKKKRHRRCRSYNRAVARQARRRLMAAKLPQPSRVETS